MLNLVCTARSFFFLLGECMKAAQGQSALSRQRSGVLLPPRAERKHLLQALASAWLNTDRKKRYLAVYIY
ncbi:unnamed protein product [Staurois parvus]|uniref:Secreted protein n=1 Tax=Staurois parvus TaxID=386267 RepID=A0ABN9G2G1_9NEOB|nr:unnamed protein product [Staurois parvus]